MRPRPGRVTTLSVTTGSGDSSQVDGFTREWEAVRADSDIQFAPVKLPEPENESSWLRDFFKWLGDVLGPLGELLGASWPVLKWILLLIAVCGAGFFLWRLLSPLLQGGARGTEDASPDEWAPEQGEARVLLEEADELASLGMFDEATHLLLRRSVQQIAAARPGTIEPSTTAREIAAMPALSDKARGAFSTIAERVERSLFALRLLSAEDWNVARAAYAEFALATPGADRGLAKG